MPDVNYTITIVDGTNSNNGVGSTANAAPMTHPEVQDGNERDQLVGMANTIFAMSALKTAIKKVDTAVGKEIKRVSLGNGSEAYQQRLEREYELIKEDATTLVAAAGLAMTGNWVGAVVALAATPIARFTQRLESSQENARLRTLDSWTQKYQNIRTGVDNRNVELLY